VDGALSDGPYVMRTGKTGSPTKYTPATVKRLLAAIADGMTLKAACVVANIGLTTLHEWRKEHPELEQKMDVAREKQRQAMLQTIKDASKEDWRAAAEYLKLVHAEDYRRVQQQNNQHLHMHKHEHVTLSIEEQARIREQRKRIIATSRDAQRVLSGGNDAHADEGEPATQFHIKKQSLLTEPEPQQPAEPEVIDAEVIDQTPHPEPAIPATAEPAPISGWVKPWLRASDEPRDNSLEGTWDGDPS
jgi:hypothetical protein